MNPAQAIAFVAAAARLVEPLRPHLARALDAHLPALADIIDRFDAMATTIRPLLDPTDLADLDHRLAEARMNVLRAADELTKARPGTPFVAN